MREYLKYLKGDNVICIITILMLAFSLVTVYSFVPILVKIEGGTPFKYLFKHFVYVVIGFTAMFWIHKKDSKYISQLAKFSFYLAIGLLIFTFFFGKEVNGAGRWINIPFVGFQSPIGLIPANTLVRVSLARWWANNNDEERCYLQLSGWYDVPQPSPSKIDEFDDLDLPF